MSLQRLLTMGGAGTIALGVGAAAFSAAKSPRGDKVFTFLTAPAEVLLPHRTANSMLTKIKYLTEIDLRLRGLEMGGNYQDTQTANVYRQKAVQAMSGSLGAARRYLGNEAALLHR